MTEIKNCGIFIPFKDLVNYNHEKASLNWKGYLKDFSSSLNAYKQAFPGKEIYLKYQPFKMSTFKILFNYGYTEDYLNEHNLVKIKYGLDEKDPQYIYKKLILNEENVEVKKNFHFYSKYEDNYDFFKIIRFNFVSTNIFEYVKTVTEVPSSRFKKSLKFKLKYIIYYLDKDIELCFLDNYIH